MKFIFFFEIANKLDLQKATTTKKNSYIEKKSSNKYKTNNKGTKQSSGL